MEDGYLYGVLTSRDIIITNSDNIVCLLNIEEIDTNIQNRVENIVGQIWIDAKSGVYTRQMTSSLQCSYTE
jgi:hypothetical protein